MIYTIVYNRYDIPRFNCLCVRPFFAVQQRNSASFRFKLQCLLDPAVAQFLNFLFPVCKSSFIWMRLNTPRGALVPLVETKWEAYCWNSWGKACGGGVGRTLKTWKPQKLRFERKSIHGYWRWWRWKLLAAWIKFRYVPKSAAWGSQA